MSIAKAQIVHIQANIVSVRLVRRWEVQERINAATVAIVAIDED